MDTLVRLTEPIDFGMGDQDQVTFPDSKAKSDAAGNLIVFSEARGEDAGSLILPAGSWRFAVSGPLTFGNAPLLPVRRSRAPLAGGQ